MEIIKTVFIWFYALSHDARLHILILYLTFVADYKRYLPCYKKMIRYSSIFDLCKSMHDTYPTIFEAYQMKCTSALPESSDNLR